VQLLVLYSKALRSYLEEVIVEILDVLEENSELYWQLIVGEDPFKSVEGLATLELDNYAILPSCNLHL